jgi:energy-coupling factor transporter ATP-binding protein EcfA2
VRLNFVRPHNSISAIPNADEIADFIVLSGPNGSGKSNLLEAVQQGALTVEGVAPGPSNAIRLFRLAELVAVSEGAQAAINFRDTWSNLANNVQNLVRQFTSSPNNMPRGSEQLESQVVSNVVGNRWITQEALDRLLAEAKKPLTEITLDDFRRHAPMLFGIRDPFQIGVGELFLTYAGNQSRNQWLQWLRDSKDRQDVSPYSDAEFERRFGPPPWEMLNETLAVMDLSYRFDPPPMEENAQYQPVLTELNTGVVVRTDQLSSGEKALLAIALTLYTGSRLGEVIELPQVLLLDEADASLHPSMIQNLLRIVETVFVDQYGVKVILSTHSPTTVALAPEQALYVMRRTEEPRLKPAASRDEALKALTIGLSTLSVKLENRRQVFVESEYDEQSYQEIYRLVRSKVPSEMSLQFIASGKGGQGNSAAVKHLVGELRKAGNDTVVGIVDRDERGGAGDGIFFSTERYSIENFILDPVVVGAFLLRERLVPADSLGLAPGTRHFELGPSHAQLLSDAVSGKILEPTDDATPLACAYVGGFSCTVPKTYLELRGHDLEDRLKNAFAPLRRFGSSLKREVILKGFGDLVDYIPADLVRLFSAVSE